MKAPSITLAFLTLTAASSAMRQLRPKAFKQPEVTPDEYEPTFIQADDTKNPRRVPKNAPSNANKDAYAALANRQDVETVEFNPSFTAGGNLITDEESNSTYRSKGAELLTMDGIDFVLISPDEMEDCDPEMAKMASDSSTCREVMDTSMEGGGMAFESTPEQGLVDDEYEVPEEERYGEEFYIQQLKELLGSDEDDENKTTFEEDFYLEEEDEDTEDGRSGRRRLNINTRDIGIFEPLQCNSAGLPSAAECEASPDALMSAVVAAAGGGKVVIPCGQCIKVS